MPLVGVRRVLHQAHDVRHDHRALAGKHEFEVALLLVLGPVGVEIVVEQDRDLARDDARVGGLLGHDRLVLLQVFEVADCRGEIVERAAERTVHRHRADITDERRGRIEVADHSPIVGFQQVLPALRHAAWRRARPC